MTEPSGESNGAARNGRGRDEDNLASRADIISRRCPLGYRLSDPPERELFESKRRPGETLLHTIARWRRCGLSCGYDPTRLLAREIAAHPDRLLETDSDGLLPIHVAATCDHQHVLPYLLGNHCAAAGLDIPTKDGHRELPLHLACMSGELKYGGDVLRQMVLEYPPSVQCRNAQGLLPLELLASSGCVVAADVFKLFIALNPASIEPRSTKGYGLLQTLLCSPHYDCARGVDVISAIVRNFPEAARVKDESSHMPLHDCAGQIYKMEVFEAILMANPDGARAEDDEGNLPLHYASYTEAVRLLLRTYPNGLRIRNRKNESPLHAAVARGALNNDSGPAMAMLETWGESAAEEVGDSGLLPLHLALSGCCSDGLANLVRELVRCFPEAVKRADPRGCLPLHLCAASFYDESDEALSVLKLLIREFPAAAVTFDSEGCRLPLSLMISSSGWRCERGARLLVKVSPRSLRKADEEGRLVIHRVLQDLMDPRLKQCGYYSMMDFSPEGFSDLVRMLANNFPESLVRTNKFGQTPLHLVVYFIIHAMRATYGGGLPSGSFDAIKSVMTVMANLRPQVLQRKDNSGQLPIHVFLQWLFGQHVLDASDAIDCVKVLFCDGCGDSGKFPVQLPNRRDVLQAAFQTGYARSSLMKYLIIKCPHLLQVEDEDGMLPLHHFLRTRADWTEGDYDLLNIILSGHSKGICHQDQDGDTPLHIAVLEDAPGRAINTLVANCPKSVHMRNSSGQTPLHSAVHFFELGRNTETIAALLRESPRALEDKNHKGETPFHHAAATWKGDRSQLWALKLMLDACPKVAVIPDHAGMWPALSAAANRERNNACTKHSLTFCKTDAKNSENQCQSNNSDDNMKENGDSLWLGVVFDLLKESQVLFESYFAPQEDDTKPTLNERKRRHPG